MQGDQLRVSPSIVDREGPAYVRQENIFPRSDSNSFLYSSQTSPDSNWRRNSGRLLIWREQHTSYHQSNTVETLGIKMVESRFGYGSHSVVILAGTCSMKEL